MSGLENRVLGFRIWGFRALGLKGFGRLGLRVSGWGRRKELMFCCSLLCVSGTDGSFLSPTKKPTDAERQKRSRQLRLGGCFWPSILFCLDL